MNCTACKLVAIHGESGHRGDYHTAVELCPLHAAAPRMRDSLMRLCDKIDAHGAEIAAELSESERAELQREYADARAILRDVDA